jgi:nucleotide-binding universal stress UspA family protein
MLVRLEHALGCPDLARQLVLVPKSRPSSLVAHQDINLVVGYDGSPCSQTALDITLWIAHQTRLATRRSVTVQVVYVIDTSAIENTAPADIALDEINADLLLPLITAQPSIPASPLRSLSEVLERCEPAALEYAAVRSHAANLVAELPRLQSNAFDVANWQAQQFERADRILWQARNLANEWRGSLKTHLRFGTVAEELCQVAIAESATVLLIGCDSSEHEMVAMLTSHHPPCPVLGIPTAACDRLHMDV